MKIQMSTMMIINSFNFQQLPLILTELTEHKKDTT